MMRKTFTYLVFCFLISVFSFVSRAQSTNGADSIISASLKNNNSSVVKDLAISWDLSTLELTENSQLTIEVQPLDNCWDGLNAIDRGVKLTTQIDINAQNVNSEVRFSHDQLMSKCVKWRYVIALQNDTSAVQVEGAWEFVNVL